MKMHIEALYVHDDQSRLTGSNNWNGGPAPRFFLGRTNQENVWRFRCDLSNDICDGISALCESEPCSISGPPVHEDEYRRILSKQGTIDSIWNGPAYWFSEKPITTNSTTLIGQHNSSLLNDGLRDWLPDIPHQQPMHAVIMDDKAVAICASVRISEAAHEAGVETLESHRHKGFALSVVSAWASAVQEQKAIPMYSTSTDNLASQRVAARLGLSKYGVDFHIT
jgi:RimJ/RimL family protein N-acetyltransferase